MFGIHGMPRTPGRRRRQASIPFLDFIFPDPPQPFSIRTLNYTDEQREFCNNITECMFDLLFTEDTEIAAKTMDATMEATKQKLELSKEFVYQTIAVFPGSYLIINTTYNDCEVEFSHIGLSIVGTMNHLLGNMINYYIYQPKYVISQILSQQTIFHLT